MSAFPDPAGDVEEGIFVIRRLASVAGPNLRGRDSETVVFLPSVAAAPPVLRCFDILFIGRAAAAFVAAFGEQIFHLISAFEGRISPIDIDSVYI